MTQIQARTRITALVALALLTAAPIAALITPTDALQQKTFWHPRLKVSGNGTAAPDLLAAGRESAALAGLTAMDAHHRSARFDDRAGRWSTLLFARPMIPGEGVGNSLAWDDFDISGLVDTRAIEGAAWSAVRNFLEAHEAELGIERDQLGRPNMGVHGEGRLVQIYVPRRINGVPVRDSYITAVLNSGNLVLYGQRNWGPAWVSTTPTLDIDGAASTVRDHLDDITFSEYRAKPRLEIVPLAAKGEFKVGAGYDYRLAWVISPRIAGSYGSWEALVDAHSGELLSFEDTNHYQASTRLVMGGVLPITNDGLDESGTEQAQWPMPFADVTDALGNRYITDSGGNLPACVEGDITTNLDSQFVRMIDNCNVLGGTTTVSSAVPVFPDIDLGFAAPASAGTDCNPVITPPSSNAPGNTRATRSGFYEVNRLAEQARGQLPTNPWLKQQLTAIMNIADVCNAFWNGSSINFFRFAGACSNTGEIAAIFDHEWGHGMDQNDVHPGVSRPGEGIADSYMFLRLGTSCVGRNFSVALGCNSPARGYGDPCNNDCDGVRDVNYHNRTSGVPHDIDFALSNCSPSGSASSPCGGSTPHCEGAIYAEAIFDLARRDLRCQGAGGWVDDGPPFDGDVEGGACADGPGTATMDASTAYELATRLAYQGAGPVNFWYDCVTDGTGGCNEDGGYLNFLAADDDNGNLFDGTPHMSAIFDAFDRHQIGCPDPAIFDNGCGGAPTQAPVVSTFALDRAVRLTWPVVPGAVSYDVFRSEGIFECDAGKTKIGTVATVDCPGGVCDFVALGLRNGFEYYFNVIAMGPSGGPANTCVSPMSDCAIETPVPGPNLALDTAGANLTILDTGEAGDNDQFLDNCEEAQLTFRVFNTGNAELTNVQVVSMSSPSNPGLAFEATPITVGTGTLQPCESGEVTVNFTAYGVASQDDVSFLAEVSATELPPGGNQEGTMSFLNVGHSDFAPFTSSLGFEDGSFGPYNILGTFVTQSNGGPGEQAPTAGAAGTASYARSSRFLDGQCDEFRTPLIQLTTTSTLSFYNQYEIEDPSATPYDRANVGIIDPATGVRTEIIPSSGRAYDLAPGSLNGACTTEGQAGWAGESANFGTVAGWEAVGFDNAALTSVGPPLGEQIQLSIVYGTDPGASFEGFLIDELVLTDFELQVPDLQSCSVNLPPDAMDDFAETVKNTAETIDVLANDDDPEGAALTIIGVQNPTALGGTAVENGGKIDYTPPLDVSGTTDTFTYDITDGTNNASALVSVILLGNLRPVATNDFAVTEVDTPVAINVLINDFDPNGDSLTIVDVDSPTVWGGTAAINPAGFIDYTPPLGFSSPPPDAFIYTISDGVDEATAVVGVGVAPDCPATPTGVFLDDVETVVPGYIQEMALRQSGGWARIDDDLDTESSPVTSWFAADGPDPVGLISSDHRLYLPPLNLTDASELTFFHNFDFGRFPTAGPTTAFQSGGVLEISVDGGSSWTDLELYITTGGYNGTVDTDASNSTNPLRGEPAWVGSSDPDPVLGGPNSTVPGRADPMTNNPVVVDLGSAILNEFGVTVAPQALVRFRLGGTFQLLTNGIQGTGWGIDDISVDALISQDNCPPIANDDAATTDPDTPIQIHVLGNDFDSNAGDTITIVSVQSPTDQGGTASINTNGTPGNPADDLIAYTPPAGFSGADDTFTYDIEDSTALSAQATVTTTVTGEVLGFCETLALPPIFDDNFNTGADPPAWTAVRDPLDHLTVVSPGLAGTEWGLQVLMNHDPAGGAEELEHFVLDKTPSGVHTYCAEFTFHPNGASLPRRVKIAAARGDDNVRLLRTMVRENPLTARGLPVLPYQVRFSAMNDNSRWVNLPWVDIPDAESLISLHWEQGTGSGDGSFRIYVDGILGEERINFNNDDRSLGAQAIGNMGLFIPGTFGTFNWDQFVSFGESGP